MIIDNISKESLNKLTGRVISQGEKALLIKSIDKNILPQWYLELLVKYRIVGTEFSLSEEKDKSKMGVEAKWLTPSQTINEAKEAYPGIVACKNGYLPVCMCLEGSGDTYFIKTSKDSDPEFVRIVHDSCDEEDFSLCEIELVCNCLSDFFNFSKTNT